MGDSRPRSLDIEAARRNGNDGWFCTVGEKKESATRGVGCWLFPFQSAQPLHTCDKCGYKTPTDGPHTPVFSKNCINMSWLREADAEGEWQWRTQSFRHHACTFNGC